ncbi:VanZ family protein [Pseudoxanthomonas gei]|uniref:VanZ family protein n=1 Tax=Pseudoxanthomonas gei TaxID=1383030 RepID=UPI001391DBF6|nr:VanZ family protein [Pseudoxanthomonas gei]
MARPLNVLRWVLCDLCVLLVVIAVLLPSRAMSWLRRDYPLINWPMSRLDHASSRFDLVHVVLFAAVSFTVSCLWPRLPWWKLALAMLALATGSELLQFWAPGREPRVSDAYDDLLGAAVGLTLALPFRWLLRRTQPPDQSE